MHLDHSYKPNSDPRPRSGPPWELCITDRSVRGCDHDEYAGAGEAGGVGHRPRARGGVGRSAGVLLASLALRAAITPGIFPHHPRLEAHPSRGRARGGRGDQGTGPDITALADPRPQRQPHVLGAGERGNNCALQACTHRTDQPGHIPGRARPAHAERVGLGHPGAHRESGCHHRPDSRRRRHPFRAVRHAALQAETIKVVVKQEQSGSDAQDVTLLSGVPVGARFDYGIRDNGDGSLTFTARYGSRSASADEPLPDAFRDATVRFQAGAYQQGNSTDTTDTADDDGARVTFYTLEEGSQTVVTSSS